MGTIVDTSKVKLNMPKSKVELEILKKLDAFGESVLDSSDSRQKHVKKKRKLEDTVTEGISRSKKKKLKKKKKSLTIDDNDEEHVEEKHTKLKGKERHLEEIKAKLGITEDDLLQFNSPSEESPRENKLTLARHKSKQREPEVIVFEDPAKRKQKREFESKSVVQASAQTGIPSTNQDVVFDMRTARHEIHRFGISGFDKPAKEEAEIQLCIKLGAEPPKKQCLNYKKLMELKKTEKREAKERQEEHNADPRYKKASSSANKSKAVSTKRKMKGGVDGQIGSYKNGVQMLSDIDIKRITGKR